MTLEYPLVICAYRDYEVIKSRLPARAVVADKYATDGWIYWWDRLGRFRYRKIKRSKP